MATAAVRFGRPVFKVAATAPSSIFRLTPAATTPFSEAWTQRWMSSRGDGGRRPPFRPMGRGDDSGRFRSRRPRPESARPQPQSSKRPVLRTHAVSLYHGDYHDEEPDADLGPKNPFAPKPLDEQWEISPTERDEDGIDQEDDDVRETEEEAAEALAAQRAYDAKKSRWLRNARPPVRVKEIDDRGRSYGRGGRKTASARVWIQPGTGEVVINRRAFVDYFPRESDREMILGPFVATETCGKFDLVAYVEGGGVTGKAGAVRHGLARALEKFNPEYRPPMKRLGYMTRDSRMVERKKVGLVKARKAPQWVRR